MNYTRRINKLSSRQFWFERNGSDSVASAISGDTLPEIKKTPGTSITISNYSRNLPRNIYIYIYTSYKHPLWYIWIKSNRGMKGAFPAQGIVTQKNARLRSRIPSMPLANYSPLHSSKSSTFLDTRCDPRRISISLSFLEKKKKIDREIGIVRYSLISLKLGKNRFLPISR